MVISVYLSIVTLNVIGLNAPIKRHRIANWIKKQDHSLYCLQETQFRAKDRLKVRDAIRYFVQTKMPRKQG